MHKSTPPKWAEHFLEWYCRADLLEQIQGDVHELYNRTAKNNKRKADFLFIWNVLRFFRWKNIKKRKPNQENTIFYAAMLKNILTVSFRNFLRYPGHSFINVTGLAAGFTCAFLILLWVSHEYSFDQFHNNKEQLYKVLTHVDANGTIQTYDVAGNNMDVSSVPEIESMTRISSGNRWPHELCFRPEGKPNECIYFNGIYSNETLFSNFNFPILSGDTNPLNKPAQIAISEKMAQTLFSSENPIGKTIKIDDTREVIIASIFKNIPGQSSIQFDFALPFDILKKQWGINDDMLAQQFFSIYLKTKLPVKTKTLTEKLNNEQVISAAYKAQNIKYEAYAFTDWHLKSKFENGLNSGGRIEYVTLFIIIGILVMLMAVINFVNMATARAALRAKEIGLRKVTGAYRGSLIVQFMGEAFFIVFVAFLISALVTQLVLPFFSQLIGEPLTLNLLSEKIPLYLASGLILIALMAGFYPAFIISSFQPATILKGQLSNATTGSLRLRKALMVVQLSASVGIIIFGSILFRQLEFITQTNLGFDRSNTIRLEPTFTLLKNYDAFKNDLLSNPIIESVGASDSNPLSTGGGNVGVTWQGKSPDLRVSFKTIGCFHDFPETIGLQLLDGNNFHAERQIHDSLATEVLISKKAAAIMGFDNPIGEKITIGDAACEIVGVVNDFHTASLHNAIEPVILYRKKIYNVSAIYIKYQAGMAQQAQEIVNTAYKKIEPTFTMKYWFQDETFNELYKTEILASRLVIIFSIIALVIAIIGIAGLATFNVMRKTKEIGIRRVFGASIPEVLGVLFKEFSWVLLFAVIVSTPIAWYSSNQWLNGFAYRTAIPWWIFVSTVVGTALLILIIIWLQGRKTIGTNPTLVLRSE
ncbi:MAG: ABC transporter permease [Cyclobacteriaceae bacterium]|nr:ABC transporter permease [Cyclobacteriaceae bacterium]UYN87249.1 MAG: ABC transporter permease [Cyclobacteriaceae bacterium]